MENSSYPAVVTYIDDYYVYALININSYERVIKTPLHEFWFTVEPGKRFMFDVSMEDDKVIFKPRLINPIIFSEEEKEQIKKWVEGFKDG